MSLALVASLWAAGANADPLPEANNLDMVKVLNDMEVIAEQHPAAKLPFMIRLIGVRSDGECDGKPQTCPTQTVYIAVSSLDEYPDRKLYQLPAAYNWQFKDWVGLPNGDAPDQYYVFTMERQVVAADLSSGWWSTELYRVTVNGYNATLELTQ